MKELFNPIYLFLLLLLFYSQDFSQTFELRPDVC